LAFIKKTFRYGWILLGVVLIIPWFLEADTVDDYWYHGTLATIVFVLLLVGAWGKLWERIQIAESQRILYLLTHQRHDLFNHIQVIMGYQMLRKQDALARYNEKLMQIAQEERKISSLQYAPLAAYLLQLRYEYRTWEWSVTLADDLPPLSVQQEKRLFEMFEEILMPYFVEQAKMASQWIRIELQLVQADGQFAVQFTAYADEGQEATYDFDVAGLAHKLKKDKHKATATWSVAEQRLSVKMQGKA
jgi:hypothetical protein